MLALFTRLRAEEEGPSDVAFAGFTVSEEEEEGAGLVMDAAAAEDVVGWCLRSGSPTRDVPAAAEDTDTAERCLRWGGEALAFAFALVLVLAVLGLALALFAWAALVSALGEDRSMALLPLVFSFSLLLTAAAGPDKALWAITGGVWGRARLFTAADGLLLFGTAAAAFGLSHTDSPSSRSCSPFCSS